MNPELLSEDIETLLPQVEGATGHMDGSRLNLMDELGFVYHSEGQYPEAEKYYLRALSLRETAYGPGSKQCLTSLHRLGVLYRVQCKFEQAELFYNRAALITKDLKGDSSTQYARCINYLAGLYHAWGLPKEAQRHVQKSMEIYRKTHGEDHHYVAFCLLALTLLYQKMGSKSMALASLSHSERLLSPLLQQIDSSSIDLPILVAALSLLYCRQERWQDATILFRYSLIEQGNEIWPEHPTVGLELEKLAKSYDSMGKTSVANYLAAQSLKIKARTFGLDHPEYQKTIAVITRMNSKFPGQLNRDDLTTLINSESSGMPHQS